MFFSYSTTQDRILVLGFKVFNLYYKGYITELPVTDYRDNPEVDILGANLYSMYLRRYRRLSGGREVSLPEQGALDKKAAVASSRTVPADAAFLPQTVRGVECRSFFLSSVLSFSI